MSNFFNYFSDKIRKSDVLSPRSKKRVQLKLKTTSSDKQKTTSSVSEEIMKAFEEDIQAMEQLDEQYFRIPADLSLTPPSKYTKEEFEETEKTFKEMELRYMQDQTFLQLLAGEVEKREMLQAKIDREKKIFANIEELMKLSDTAKIKKLIDEMKLK